MGRTAGTRHVDKEGMPPWIIGQFGVEGRGQQVLLACRYVDAVLLEASLETTRDFMLKHAFSVYAFACANAVERQQKLDHCRSLPLSMYHELEYTQGLSTSEIVSRINRLYRTFD